MSAWGRQIRGGGRRRGRRRGFTLVEVLVAMIFMSIVVPVSVQGILVASRAGVVAERKRVAARLADNLLTELIVTEEWVDGDTEGFFEEEWANYRWEMDAETWEEDNLSDSEPMTLLTLWVVFVVQGREYGVQVSTLVEEEEEESESEGLL